jgi:malate/lactate dehydrogenase
MKVIITGATGMVGEGVLHECVLSEKVSSILVIGQAMIKSVLQIYPNSTIEVADILKIAKS